VATRVFFIPFAILWFINVLRRLIPDVRIHDVEGANSSKDEGDEASEDKQHV
jgi:hypothetical protein